MTRNPLLTAIVLLLFALCSSHGAVQNLLINGSFEEDMQTGSIPGWKFSTGLRQQQIWLDTEEVKNGERSLAVRIAQSTDLEVGTDSEQVVLMTTPEKESIISQSVALEKHSRYMFSIWFKRDTFVFGSYLFLKLYDEQDNELRSYRQVLRASDWMNFQIAFSSDEAVRAKVQIYTPNVGVWRVTVGRTLWVDDASLVKVDSADQVQELSVAAALQGEALLQSGAAGRMYPWLELSVPEGVEDAWVELEVDGNTHRFRSYSAGDSVWVQPILPDLIVAEGEYPVRLRSDDAVRVGRLLLTRDATWRPEGAADFLPVDKIAGGAMLSPAEEQSDIQVVLRMDGELPQGTWPVAQGVPFARGALRDTSDLRLTDASGKSVPMQTDVLMRWPDGSVRWLLVSTQGAGGQEFVLQNNAALAVAAPVNPVSVLENNSGIIVRNGVIEIEVPSRGEKLLGAVKVGGRGLFSTGDLVVNGSFVARADDAQATVEEAGLLRAVIRLRGSHQAQSGDRFLDYDLRLIVHAGSSRIDIEHTFYHRKEPLEVAIEQMELVFATAPGVGFKEAGLHYGEKWHSIPLQGTGVELTALLTEDSETAANYPYLITSDKKMVHEGYFYQGDFSISGGWATVQGWIQDFWQNAPRSLKFSNSELAIGLIDQPGSPFYMGMAKTYRLALDLAGNVDSIAAYRAEPLLLADRQWYADTEATGHLFGPRVEGSFAAYEYSMQLAIQRWIDRTDSSLKRLVGAGILNYGDPVGGRNSHGNNLETARDEGSLIQFLRTQDRYVYDHARVAIDHFIDIDIDHSDRNQGLIWVHGKHERTQLDAGRRGVNGHSWFNGVTHFEMFRGSRRILDVADNVGAYYSGYGFELEPYVRPWRPLSWQLMSLLQAYEVSGNPAYLEQARQSMIVTRHQRDFLIEEWPYMFSTGLKAVRMYYQATGDPEAKELYLQLMDGFLRLRERPTDTVNGEWLKPEGTILGNFPNDRSCMFYNEAAWAYWLSGDRSYVDKAATDLNWHSAFAVSDPTLLAGSADLVRAMRELEIADAAVAVTLPYVEMLPEQDDLQVDGRQRAGLVQFIIENEADDAFELILFKGARFKYMIPYEGTATLSDMEGTILDQIEISNKGINIYRLQSGGAAQKGRYIVTIELDNIWQWTVQEIPLQLNAGHNMLEVTSRNGSFSIDRFAVAPVGVFPWLDEGQEHLQQIDSGEMILGEGWQRYNDERTAGGSYVRRSSGTNRSVLQVPVEVPSAGEYRLYAKIWRPTHDALDITVNGSSSEPQQLYQVHDMAGSRVEPQWSLAVEKGNVEILRYWKEDTVFTTYSPFFFNAAASMPDEDWQVFAGSGEAEFLRAADGELAAHSIDTVKIRQDSSCRDFAIGNEYVDASVTESTRPYRIRFQWLASDLSAFENGDKTWLRFFSSPRGNRAGRHASFWFGALSNQRGNQIQAWDGDRSGGVSSTVETGIVLREDALYEFEIDVYPESRSWRLRIREGDHFYESELLGWRSSGPTAGSILTFNTQINDSNAGSLECLMSPPQLESL